MAVLEHYLNVGHKELEFNSKGEPYERLSLYPIADPTTGSVDVEIKVYNAGTKPIKYLTYTFVPYNRVGDIVASEIEDKVEAVCRITGPIQPGVVNNELIFEHVWYNSTITKIEVKEVLVQYMDGSEEILKPEDIKSMYDDDSEYHKAHPKKKGCYVATAVYGSYDCPEVWTLRRYRDFKLAKTWYGRAFIHTYYAISPTLVRWFGNTDWFKKLWKEPLDRMISKLNQNGVGGEPYDDREW